MVAVGVLDCLRLAVALVVAVVLVVDNSADTAAVVGLVAVAGLDH